MSGFDAGWLDLRAAADARARNSDVLAACKRHFAGHDALSVSDLGSGTGAAVRAFAPLLPQQQRWRLVDDDAGNLAEARRRLATSGVEVETRAVDLAATPAAWPDGCGLVTATALFDLAGPAWIERLADALARDRIALLATLTYDGDQRLAPPHADDAAMLAAFNRHQRLDKGLGGPAAGPDGATRLADALRGRGYRVVSGTSPWRLERRRDGALIDAVVAGWADAVAEAGFVAPKTAAAWRAARVGGSTALVVGHVDLFAVPEA